MTAILILFMFVAFVGMDFLVRTTLRRRREHRERQAREAVLNTSVKLDFTHEAKSLKRVEVPNPKARILAVDDEAVVLDSFRPSWCWRDSVWIRSSTAPRPWGWFSVATTTSSSLTSRCRTWTAWKW